MQNNVKVDAEKGKPPKCCLKGKRARYFPCGSSGRSMLYCRYTLRIKMKWLEGEIGFEKEKRYQGTFACACVCFGYVGVRGRKEREEKRMPL